MSEEHRSPTLVIDVIIEKADEIVLIKHRNDWFKDRWGMPGGHVEHGETVEQAAVREAQEETSLLVKPKAILGVYSDAGRDERGHYITTVFIADYVAGELRGKDDASEARWVNIADISKMDLAGDHPKILEDYMKWRSERGTYWSTK